jgi:hypothetical protein
MIAAVGRVGIAPPYPEDDAGVNFVYHGRRSKAPIDVASDAATLLQQPPDDELASSRADAAGAERERGRFGPRDALELLTVLALVVYGAVHFGEYAFYARLGASPDDVGLDYTHTLGRVAVGFGLLAGTVMFLLAAGALMGSKRDDVAGSLFEFVVCAPAVLVGYILLATLLPPLPRWTIWVAVVAVIALGAVLEATYRSGALARWLRTFDLRHAIVLGAIGLVASFGLAGAAGYHAAGYVLAGEDLPCGCSKIFGINVALPWVNGSRGFMGIQAERAQVSWVGPQHPDTRRPRRALYLGTADGLVALYDVDLGRTVRIPAQAISFSTEGAGRPFTRR